MKDRRSTYDPARVLTMAALAFVGLLIVFVCFIIGSQILKSGTANTESWAALTGLIGWATGVVGMIYSARYGTTQQSAAKDATIQQQAHTAAVVAGAAKPDAGGTIKTDEVKIDAQTATVTTEASPKEAKP